MKDQLFSTVYEPIGTPCVLQCFLMNPVHGKCIAEAANSSSRQAKAIILYKKNSLKFEDWAWSSILQNFSACFQKSLSWSQIEPSVRRMQLCNFSYCKVKLYPGIISDCELLYSKYNLDLDLSRNFREAKRICLKIALLRCFDWLKTVMWLF